MRLKKGDRIISRRQWFHRAYVTLALSNSCYHLIYQNYPGGSWHRASSSISGIDLYDQYISDLEDLL